MKVLFVATSFPVPPHAGAKVALLETLRSIERLCELHLLLPRTEENSAADLAALQQLVPNTQIHFYQPRPGQPATLEKFAIAARTAFSRNSYHASIWLDQNLRSAAAKLCDKYPFDLVHCEWLYPAIALQEMDLPLVVRTLDLHFVIMKDGVEEIPDDKKLRKTLWRLEAERFRQFEVGIFNKALITIAVSAEDEAVLRREGVSRLVRIPPPMTVPEQSPVVSADNKTCTALFLCMLHAMVNRESSFLFTDEIWPKISEQVRASVQVVFAGGNPDEGARQRAQECGIRMEAPLPDEQARSWRQWPTANQSLAFEILFAAFRWKMVNTHSSLIPTKSLRFFLRNWSAIPRCGVSWEKPRASSSAKTSIRRLWANS